MREVHSVIAYTDDIAILVEEDSRKEIEDKTRIIMIRVKQWCDNNKLTISTEKTKYIIFKSKLEKNPTIKYNNEPIKRVKSFKYLGITIDEKLNFEEHIENIKSRIVKVGNKLATIANNKYGLPIRLLKLYNNQIINAIGTYGASVWAHRLNENKKLAEGINGAQRRVLLRLSGAYRTAPGVALNIILGVAPLHLEVIRTATL